MFAFFFQTKRVLCNKVNTYTMFSGLWHPVSLMRMGWILTMGTLRTVQQSKSQMTNSLPAHNEMEIGYSMHTSKNFHNFPIFHKDRWVIFLWRYHQSYYAGRLLPWSRWRCWSRCSLLQAHISVLSELRITTSNTWPELRASSTA